MATSVSPWVRAQLAEANRVVASLTPRSAEKGTCSGGGVECVAAGVPPRGRGKRSAVQPESPVSDSSGGERRLAGRERGGVLVAQIDCGDAPAVVAAAVVADGTPVPPSSRLPAPRRSSYGTRAVRGKW